MSEIKIWINKELTGNKPYMGVVFIDSYGDVLLKELTLQDSGIFDEYFTLCSICGLPVVDSSIVPDTGGMCDHCYKSVPVTITD
jgi:hypothetical protein